ncbi:hypothetical protein CVT24_003645 [Panaeolus cyanescens]|uniref:Uncharacterized protein n=1 Tax=Panaeolus cyanescens TaxID=181874 RepID=A0A409X401_9AGAR|nr:hypothetical protein CVT24_003645 [Panaeolus cyanescens]
MDYTQFVVIYALVIFFLALSVALAFVVRDFRRDRPRGAARQLEEGMDGMDGRDDEVENDGDEAGMGHDGWDDERDEHWHARHADGRNDDIPTQPTQPQDRPNERVIPHNTNFTEIRVDARYGYQHDVFMRVKARIQAQEHEMRVDIRHGSA